MRTQPASTPATTGPQDAQAAKSQTEDRGEAVLVGNLTKDPVLRFTSQGTAVLNMRIAVTPRIYNSHAGRWEDQATVYNDAVCWGRTAENAAECLHKGDRVILIGRWQAKEYQDEQGETRERITANAREVGISLVFNLAHQVRGPQNGGH